jgi:hypothetical protein
MALRFLMVEGNTRPARERHAAAYGVACILRRDAPSD